MVQTSLRWLLRFQSAARHFQYLMYLKVTIDGVNAFVVQQDLLLRCDWHCILVQVWEMGPWMQMRSSDAQVMFKWLCHYSPCSWPYIKERTQREDGRMRNRWNDGKTACSKGSWKTGKFAGEHSHKIRSNIWHSTRNATSYKHRFPVWSSKTTTIIAKCFSFSNRRVSASSNSAPSTYVNALNRSCLQLVASEALDLRVFGDSHRGFAGSIMSSMTIQLWSLFWSKRKRVRLSTFAGTRMDIK